MANMEQKCACRGDFLDRLVQPAALSILYRQPDYGYNLIKQLAKTRLWNGKTPDASGIYRILKDMEKRGLLTSRIDLADNQNMGKRIFSVTPEGIACMHRWEETLSDYHEGIGEMLNEIRGFREAGEKRSNMEKGSRHKSGRSFSEN